LLIDSLLTPIVESTYLSYQMIIINQAQQVMRCDIMMFLTCCPVLTLLHSFRHERMLVFRTLGLV